MLNASWLKLDTLLETASVLILFLRIRRIDSLEISILSGIPARAKAANEASNIEKGAVDNVAEAGNATRKFVGEAADEGKDLKNAIKQ